jgi:Fur family peroxide stress response transcriptional regulator
MREHCHFFCEKCGEVTDIELPVQAALSAVPLPSGFEVGTCDISLRGVCPRCGGKLERERGKRPAPAK